MKVFVSSLLSFFIALAICRYYLIPKTIRYIEADNIHNMIMIKKLFKKYPNKSIELLSNLIENNFLILKADNHKIISTEDIVEIINTNPLDKLCKIDYVDNSSEIEKFCNEN